jgi:membrane-associated phospholipid phosphatase
MASGWKRPLSLATLCWVFFGCLLAAAYWLPVARWADGWAVEGFINLQKPWLSSLAHHVAQLADPGPFAVWTVLLAGIALYRRMPRHALGVIFLLGGANVVSQVLKILLAHGRWHDFLGHAQIARAAFPSGHATASMALAFAAVLIAPVAWRPVVAVAGSLFALLVSESIMLMAWHFPSDVAAGFLVATSFALFTVAGLRAAEERWPERTGRKAARRVFAEVDARRVATVVAAFVLAALAGVAIAAGDRTLTFAGRHTTAVLASVVVAAMAAALPVSIAAFGARRP